MNIDKYIYENKEVPLSKVIFHEDVSCITRYFAEEFPVYHAIHKITDAKEVSIYTHKHKHDTDEINIIISEDFTLKYRIEIEDEEIIIGPNTSVYIPANKMHSANVISGSGYFIALRGSLPRSTTS